MTKRTRAAAAATTTATDSTATPPPRKYPATQFGSWTYDDASEALDEAKEQSELDSTRTMREAAATIPDQAVYFDPRARLDQLAVNRAFYEGDHWQMGAGWIGPHPQLGDKDYVTAMNELVGAFTSKNVIREVVARHAAGLIGREPTWSFVPRRTLTPSDKPNDAEVAAVAEANALMREWWDARKVRSVLYDAVCTLLFAARAPLRLYIPPGLLTKRVRADGTVERVVEAANVREALSLIWPDHPMPEHAAVVQDEDTKMEAGIRQFVAIDDDAGDDAETRVDADADDDETIADDAAAQNANVAKGDDDDERECIEIVYLTETGATCIRIVDEDDDDARTAQEFAYDFGARLTMVEMRRAPLITPQVTQQQRALNLAISMLPRSVITGGFLERVLLNAQMPGRYVRDTPDGAQRFIPDPIQFGPSTTNFFAGIETKDANGNKTVATPSVHYRDPVPVDSPVKAAQEHYFAILDEVSQLHVVLSGDAVVSGKSREQARAEYLRSLGDTRSEVEAALRFALETPLAMAEALSGQTGRLTKLVRIEAQCRIDSGPIDATERAANEASVGKTLSQETAMARNGVDDVDAEMARMSADPLARATLALAQGQALVQWTTAGASIESAAKIIGIDPNVAATLIGDVQSGGFTNAPAPKPGDASSNGQKPNSDRSANSNANNNGSANNGTKPNTQASSRVAATGGAVSNAGGAK